jgi:hypothetical protein
MRVGEWGDLLAVADAESDVVPHLREAEKIALGISGEHNEYAHKDCFIRWKGEDGATVFANRTDCSDFLNLLLEHAYHVTRDDLRRLTGRERPTASAWYETIYGGRGFEVVASVREIRAGDILAVQYPPGGEDTGHVMIADSGARKREATTPVVEGTTQWELVVIDSSKSGHGLKDTRHRVDGGFDRGVGKGTLRLYSGADGAVAGYAWSVSSKSKFESVSEHRVVIGRLKVGEILGGGRS